MPEWIFNEVGYAQVVPADVPERIRRSLGTTSIRASTCETDVHLRLSAVVRCAIKYRGYDARSADYSASHTV